MTAHVFLGPTLNKQEARKILPSAQYHPPIKRGDLLQILHQKPTVIAIIDGVFEQNLPIWHKEILYALSQGVQVYGASSMGALRAAELDRYGMIGSGLIFNKYKSGEIMADDEVALQFDPRTNHTKGTPLVNVRATLNKALDENIITNDAYDDLLNTISNQPYFKRDLFKTLRHTDLSTDIVGWFKNNYVDQKKIDAISLLRTLNETKTHPALAGFAFNESIFFRKSLLQAHAKIRRQLHIRISEAIALHTQRIKCSSRFAIKETIPLKAYLVYTNEFEEKKHLCDMPLEDIEAQSLSPDEELITQNVQGILNIEKFLINSVFDISQFFIKQVSEQFRLAKGLSSAKDTHAWLEAIGISNVDAHSSFFAYFAIISLLATT